MTYERSPEKPRSKDFGFEINKVDRKLGHVFIQYGGKTYKWFLRKEDRLPILLNGDERGLTDSAREAMENQVRAILGPVATPSKSDMRPARQKRQ